MFIRARVFASLSGALAVVALTVPWCVVVKVVTLGDACMHEFIHSSLIVARCAVRVVCVSLNVY